ncbi:trithorax group protein osa isoform X2 [Drosophila innubila]|uniref:trithorax group protein osa isoform X2 n=1 Tax=Drosophila innubila TaxID=198719 RepID=UPI00148D1E22|nr:trithorax group protein osa isoform X2 [Drosophila innubila]
MLIHLTIVTTFCFCASPAVLIGKSGSDSYGQPPSLILQYGPPKHHTPHREYGVPQQIPFQEYGPPALKYGPPKLNFLGVGGGSSSSSGLHEQIKTHFGVPKPFYGPPHIHHKPATQYGSPSSKSVYGPTPTKYGPPLQPPQQYGPPKQPSLQYGPPPTLKLQHHSAQRYGPPPPKPHFHISSATTQPLPPPHPAPLFKPANQPSTSYGPPASGPLNLPPKPVYETPANYEPPPLPISLPRPQSASNNRVPTQTIIFTGPGGQLLPGGATGGPVKQAQILIDASGHTHSSSQVPFHTACDGWKPIPAPVGAYFEENRIETQDGYSNVQQGPIKGNSESQNFGTKYSVSSTTEEGGIIDGLSDEQLVAVALQKDASNVITGTGGDAHLNNIESDALQLSIGSIDDSYSKPPADSFAPGAVHAHKYQTLVGGSGVALPLSPAPIPQYGALPPQRATLTSSNGQAHSHSNINIQFDSASGNPQPLPQHGASHPNTPVAYRSPVPTGLLESIGATVHHLDLFGVKPQQQPPTYIPPAAHEIALNVPPAPPQVLYGAPFNQALSPQVIVQQQLPQSQLRLAFKPQKHVPVPLPQSHYQPAPLQPPTKQQYLPPPTFFHQQQHQHSENSYSASQYAQQYVYSQGLPLVQKESRFNQQPFVVNGPPPSPKTVIVHDCGHGPNFVNNNGYQIQQQQQTFGSVTAASDGSYNAIAQSIPVAEQHTQFLSIPADSYGPPPSGNNFDFDHSGYASQKSAVTALPGDTDPQQLPDLNGLNVISAQKSQSINLGSGVDKPIQNFEVQFSSLLNRATGNDGNGAAHVEQGANHEEILSQGLLQSILTAIEQPQSPSAQSRSDKHQHNDQNEDPLEFEKEVRVELPALSIANGNEEERHKKVKEIQPIKAVEVKKDVMN